jgi:hypothetical protein
MSGAPNQRAGGVKGGIPFPFQIARSLPALPQHEGWAIAPD